MAEKLTVGVKPESRKKPATDPKFLSEQEAVSSEKFPDNFADSLKLLKELSAEPVSSEEEWDSKQPKLKALKAHV